jgi:uncharacterized protein (TIGR02231 family)
MDIAAVSPLTIDPKDLFCPGGKMRKFSIAVFFLVTAVYSAVASAQTVPSQIKKVTLFSNQALVHREATTTAHRGFNELLIAVETFQLDPDSVAAKVFGTGEIYSVQYKNLPVKEPPQDKVRRLEEKLMQLTRVRKELGDQQNSLKKQEAFLDSFIDFSKTQIPRDVATRLPKPEELKPTLTFLKTNYQKIYAQIRALDMKVIDVDKDIKVVKQELSAVRGARRQSLGVIEILFRSAQEQKIRIEVQYLARNARWQPLYKVAVPANLSAIDLTMFSKITQKTGENWNQVQLAVSTVIPLRGVGLPNLYSWLLDLPRPVVMRDRSAVLKKSAPTAPMEVAVSAEADATEPEASFVQARRSEQPLSFEYALSRPINIESRDKETLLPLFTKKLKGTFFYYAVPKQSALTFLVARVQADKELLRGTLNVYFNGQYVGKTFLPAKKAAESFDLGLGADREVLVKREKIHDKVRETYFGKFERDSVVRELTYKITAENLKRETVTLRIQDHIPVSKTDRIEVQDLKLVPAPSQKDVLDRQGVMLWERQLQPGAQEEITIAFVVTYPKEFPPAF